VPCKFFHEITPQIAGTVQVNERYSIGLRAIFQKGVRQLNVNRCNSFVHFEYLANQIGFIVAERHGSTH